MHQNSDFAVHDVVSCDGKIINIFIKSTYASNQSMSNQLRVIKTTTFYYIATVPPRQI